MELFVHNICNLQFQRKLKNIFCPLNTVLNFCVSCFMCFFIKKKFKVYDLLTVYKQIKNK